MRLAQWCCCWQGALARYVRHALRWTPGPDATWTMLDPGALHLEVTCTIDAWSVRDERCVGDNAINGAASERGQRNLGGRGTSLMGARRLQTGARPTIVV
jgi:hypothetical protein